MKTSTSWFYRLSAVVSSVIAFHAYGQTPPTLAITGNRERVDIIFTGTHILEATGEITGPWVSLGSQTSPFTDPDSATLSRRFYRLHDGDVFSANAVGFYRLALCEGFSLIANQLNHSPNNTLESIFNTASNTPDGVAIYKYNPSTGGYVYKVYAGGAWFGDPDTVMLNPGEGAYLNAPIAFNHRFLGDVPMAPCIPIRPGFSIISCPLPKICPLITGFETGFPVGDEDTVYRAISCSGPLHFSYDVYTGGEWFGDSLGTPVMNVGEAFWFHRQFSNGAASWCRFFSVGF